MYIYCLCKRQRRRLSYMLRRMPEAPTHPRVYHMTETPQSNQVHDGKQAILWQRINATCGVESVSFLHERLEILLWSCSTGCKGFVFPSSTWQLRSTECDASYIVILQWRVAYPAWRPIQRKRTRYSVDDASLLDAAMPRLLKAPEELV